MEIYLLRHGIAEDPRPGTKDADRALTAEGKKRLREVLLVARGAGLKPELILTSPYRRARETAEVAANVLEYDGELTPCPTLTPMAGPREAWEDIKTFRNSESLLLVSHEPLTGMLIGFLLGAPQLAVDVKKSSITRIDVESFGMNPHGVLRWMLTPKIAGVLAD